MNPYMEEVEQGHEVTSSDDRETGRVELSRGEASESVETDTDRQRKGER